MKALQFVALVVEDDAPVREHAIHIEDEEFDPPCALGYCGFLVFHFRHVTSKT
jgi:hypothetical protein